jgi:sugar phosphate isomerase/epimerase
VRRIASPRVRLCLDLGHAHLVADLSRRALADLVAPCLEDVGLFELHDSLGARRGPRRPPGVTPPRLELHLPPGAGTSRGT